MMTRVIKSNGQIEEYDKKKIIESLKKANIPKKLHRIILKKVDEILYDTITTKEIYSVVKTILNETNYLDAHKKYTIKEAIMDLGPGGFGFEKFVAQLLEAKGYKCQTGVITVGRCVSHEIDVVAIKDKIHIMVECKHHHKFGSKTDVRVPLYSYARFLDIQDRLKWELGQKQIFHQAWIVTNTRVTTDCIKYGECTGMQIISWDHPKNRGLKDMISETHIYPITSLKCLPKAKAKKLIDSGIVTFNDIIKHQKRLPKLGLKKDEIESIVKEINQNNK